MLHAGLRGETFALFIHKNLQKNQFNSLTHLAEKKIMLILTKQ